MRSTSLSLLSLLIAFGDVASVAGQSQECVSTAQALAAVENLPITPADTDALTSLIVGKLNDVIKLTDTNSDCKWSVSEINDLFALYTIDPLKDNLCKCTSIEQLVAEYATDTVNGLTPTELLNLASGREELGIQLAFALIGVPEPSGLVTLFAGATTPSADIIAVRAPAQLLMCCQRGIEWQPAPGLTANAWLSARHHLPSCCTRAEVPRLNRASLAGHGGRRGLL